MRKKIIYLAILLLIPSCTYKVDCPGYPDKYLVWMPYSKDEKISFTDGTDTFQLMVEAYDIDEPHTEKRLKFQRGAECDNSAYWSIKGDSIPGITIISDGYDYEADFFISFQFDSGSETLQFRDNNGESFLTDWPYQHNEFFNSYDNGCKVFNDVLMIETDTLAADIRIYQIYFAKEAGIIQFKDRLNHKTWSLVQ
jgi:hypothetical protein